MLEKTLRVGDLIFGFNFPTETSGGDPELCSKGVDLHAFFQVKRMTERRVHLFSKDKVEVPEYIKLRFTWLPWIDGKVNYCSSLGRDVLSGPFSGCWMARYKENDRRVCHIALQDNDKDCKQAWRNKKAEANTKDVKEFRPHEATEGAFRLGLVTKKGDLYAIGLNPAKKILIKNPRRKPEDWDEKYSLELRQKLAKAEEVDSNAIYGCEGYRVLQIAGPLQPQPFPT